MMQLPKSLRENHIMVMQPYSGIVVG